MSALSTIRATIRAIDASVNASPQNGSSSWLMTSIFKAASTLTDPICKAHEYTRLLHVVHSLHPKASDLSNLGRKISLCIGILGWAVLSIGTAIPGAALRAYGIFLQKEPFLHFQGSAKPKTLSSEHPFSLLSWNICCVAGGYTVTDGGIMPWVYRIDDIVRKIVEKGADVNCLYETFDTKSAFYLCEKLRNRGYHHFYWNIGPRTFGVSSGIFVASKYKIQNPEFTPFPLESLIGRTKQAAKGIFAFDLVSQGKSFARIFSTHLQHSEEPEFPTQEEILARQKQMRIILDKIHGVQDRCIVVTGDLNLGDAEYNASSWHKRFYKETLACNKTNGTWGGDAFCARLMGKRISGPLNLDHTMVLNRTARKIHTSFVETGFDATVFKEGVLSDHQGLFTQIWV